MNNLFFFLLLLPMLACTGNKTKMEINGDAMAVSMNKDNLVFDLLVRDSIFYGIRNVTIDGVPTSSVNTCFFPLIAQDWGKEKVIIPFLKIKNILETSTGIEIRCSLFSTKKESTFRDYFVYTLDRERIMNEEKDPMFLKLKSEAEHALSFLKEKASKEKDAVRWQTQVSYYKGRKEKSTSEFDKKRFSVLEMSFQEKYEKAIQNLVKKKMRNREEFQSYYKKIDTLDAYVDKFTSRYGKIHRDNYFFPHLRQPESIANPDSLYTFYQAAGELEDAGEFIWFIEPYEEVVAGFPWKGWKHSVKMQLKNNNVNNIRFLGTWELNGEAAGNTLIGMRYRGLGTIEQKLEKGSEGYVMQAWNTADVLPSLLTDNVCVSPVEVKSLQIGDRDYALKHRSGAWLIYPPRGADVPLFDYQYNNKQALYISFSKSGSLRGMSEVYPGDHCVSFTDEQWFANTKNYETIEQVFLLHKAEKQEDEAYWRTRWKEMDRYTRDKVSEELGFIQSNVLPAVGMNWDYWSMKNTFSCAIENLNEKIDTLAAEGVRMILNHNSGWINGNTIKLAMDGADSNLFVGSGSCVVYDWVPLPDIRETWKKMNEKMKKLSMRYFIWVTGFTQYYGSFFREVGESQENWALNKPGENYMKDQISWELPNNNILSPRFKEVFHKKIVDAANEYGFQGIWADSYQLSWMSQLNWADGSGESLQRAWWDQIAEWSREGIDFMSEGFGAPGLSCSIEVMDWDKCYWAFQDVCKWLRNGEHKHYNHERMDSLGFLLMSNKGWLAFDILEWSYCKPYQVPSEIMPSFKRLSDEYMAALEYMNRPYLLPNNAGIIYFPFKDDNTAVFFSYKHQDFSEGVDAAYILDEDVKSANAVKWKTYKVKGRDLFKKFGITKPLLKDERKKI